MDKANKLVGSSSDSSSSFAADLFGPKDCSKSSNSSSSYFGSIFGPPTSMVPGKEFPIKREATTDYKSEEGNPVKKDRNSSYENGRSVEPCYYNSSIYYGGQEVYSPNNLKKDGGNVEQNESNSSCASRGNWWQGSLYY